MIEKSDCGELIRLYREWNEKINVVSRKDIDNIYEHHILHSLAIGEYWRHFYGKDAAIWKSGTVLDIGTGGGFPGIPLAMEFGEMRFTLCDSIAKKIKVASAVADGLALKNVDCIVSRAELLQGTFDWVLSRAVAPLDTLYSWVKGRFGKSLICLKGGDGVTGEISSLARKYGIDMRKVRTWNIREWLDDDYFSEKFVIEIGKDYLCPPKFE